MSNVTEIIKRAESGDVTAIQELFPIVYNELRVQAAQKMARESPGHTLQATALVHEAWLRLGGDSQPQWKSRAHFFAATALAMRRILIDNARRKQRACHGGGCERVPWDHLQVPAQASTPEELLKVDEALDKLTEIAPRQAKLVHYLYFCGMTYAQAAALMEVSEATAKRDWVFARAWLFKAIKGDNHPPPLIPPPD